MSRPHAGSTLARSTLAARDLLPGERLVDTGYTDARLLVASKAAYGMELLSPVQTDVLWQSTAPAP